MNRGRTQECVVRSEWHAERDYLPVRCRPSAIDLREANVRVVPLSRKETAAGVSNRGQLTGKNGVVSEPAPRDAHRDAKPNTAALPHLGRSPRLVSKTINVIARNLDCFIHECGDESAERTRS